MPKTKRVKRGGIYILSLLIIIMSVYFYYYLISIDERYSKIIANEGTFYNNVQNITFGADKGYLLLFKIMGTSDKANRDSLINEKRLLVAKNDSLINAILFNIDVYKNKSFLNGVIAARMEYIQNTAVFIDYLSTNKDSAVNILMNKIEPSFLKYQEELKSFIVSNYANVLEYSGNISSDVKTKSQWMLLLGLSPVLLFTVFLILLGIFLAIMIIFLKDVEYER
jgi:hypothetical protein